MRTCGVGVVVVALMSSCGRNTARQEVIQKLRCLGVLADPLVSTPSAKKGAATVNLLIHVAVPSGGSVSVSPFKDTVQNETGVTLSTSDLKVDSGSAKYQEFGGIRLFTVNATAVVPTIATFTGNPSSFIGATVKYGFRVEAGSSSENMIGTFLVEPEGAAALAWKAPTIDIPAVTDGMSVAKGDVPIAAKVTDTNGEDTKLGWFVTSGQVTDRRSASTTWSADTVGSQTMIVTVHGNQSRGFGLKAVAVVVK